MQFEVQIDDVDLLPTGGPSPGIVACWRVAMLQAIIIFLAGIVVYMMVLVDDMTMESTGIVLVTCIFSGLVVISCLNEWDLGRPHYNKLPFRVTYALAAIGCSLAWTSVVFSSETNEMTGLSVLMFCEINFVIALRLIFA